MSLYSDVSVDQFLALTSDDIFNIFRHVILFSKIFKKENDKRRLRIGHVVLSATTHIVSLHYSHYVYHALKQLSRTISTKNSDC